MIEEPRCSKRKCLHFLGVLQDKDEEGVPTEVGERPYCPAFPDGIPEEIAYGDNLHKEKHPDQVGPQLYEEDTSE